MARTGRVPTGIAPWGHRVAPRDERNTMPAITAPDITKLERVPAVPESARQRPVREVVLAPHGLEGEGFPVRWAFAGADLTDLDPFVPLDQMGEGEDAPREAKGTPWHPR